MHQSSQELDQHSNISLVRLLQYLQITNADQLQLNYCNKVFHINLLIKN